MELYNNCRKHITIGQRSAQLSRSQPLPQHRTRIRVWSRCAKENGQEMLKNIHPNYSRKPQAGSLFYSRVLEVLSILRYHDINLLNFIYIRPYFSPNPL